MRTGIWAIMLDDYALKNVFIMKFKSGIVQRTNQDWDFIGKE